EALQPPPNHMKLRILLGFLVVLAGLWWLNRRLNHNPRYMESASSTAEGVKETDRGRFMVGFLPVT
ncbi:MAG: hypothetical protein RIR65_1027, partial [Planctomycetota bacterium]